MKLDRLGSSLFNVHTVNNVGCLRTYAVCFRREKQMTKIVTDALRVKITLAASLATTDPTSLKKCQSRINP